MDTILSEIFFDAGYIFIIIGTFIALLFGLGLIFAPTITLKLNNKINTKISMRKSTKKIETPIQSEPVFYKYAKTSGTLITLGSAFVIYTLLTFNFYNLIPYFPRSLPPYVWEWLFQAGQIFFFVTCIFIMAFGLVVLIRPSQLKAFEEKANHWISTRKSFYKMSTDINLINKLVNLYPRIFGGLTCIVSLSILLLLLSSL